MEMLKASKELFNVRFSVIINKKVISNTVLIECINQRDVNKLKQNLKEEIADLYACHVNFVTIQGIALGRKTIEWINII